MPVGQQSNAPQRVKITQGTRGLDGPLAPGDVVELPGRVAAELIASNKAVAAVEEEKPKRAGRRKAAAKGGGTETAAAAPDETRGEDS